jgi:hypothetical protein
MKKPRPRESAVAPLAKTSLVLDGEVYIRALTYKASLRRVSATGTKGLMGQIVSQALDQYLKRQGF